MQNENDAVVVVVGIVVEMMDVYAGVVINCCVVVEIVLAWLFKTDIVTMPAMHVAMKSPSHSKKLFEQSINQV